MGIAINRVIRNTGNRPPRFDLNLFEPRGKPRGRNLEPIGEDGISQLKDEFFGQMKPATLNRILLNAKEEGWSYERTETMLRSQI
ncbi:MAG: hypothetical protein ABII22_07250 [Candidatus Micrarchaeota archaeon]